MIKLPCKRRPEINWFIRLCVGVRTVFHRLIAGGNYFFHRLFEGRRLFEGGDCFKCCSLEVVPSILCFIIPINQKNIKSNKLNIVFQISNLVQSLNCHGSDSTQSWPGGGGEKKEKMLRGVGGGWLFEGCDLSRDGYYSRKYGNAILFIYLFIHCLPLLVCFILFCSHRLVCIKTRHQIHNLKHTVIRNDTLHKNGTLLDVSCVIFSH